jgi:hypothetical protein
LEFTEAAERRMREHVVRHPRRQRPRHDYRLETFGIRPDEVDARFQPLRDVLDAGSARHRGGPVVTVPDATVPPTLSPTH